MNAASRRPSRLRRLATTCRQSVVASPTTPLRTRRDSEHRVSTAGQEYGFEAQRHTIVREAVRRGWNVGWVEGEGRSGRPSIVPGILRALALLAAGDAEALVVSKLDGLSRSLANFSRIFETATGQGWGVVALDLGVDITTATGRLVACVMAAVASWEREVIGQRTKEGPAVAKAKSVRLGAPC